MRAAAMMTAHMNMPAAVVADAALSSTKKRKSTPSPNRRLPVRHTRSV
jgi:hypothetical protein